MSLPLWQLACSRRQHPGRPRCPPQCRRLEGRCRPAGHRCLRGRRGSLQCLMAPLPAPQTVRINDDDEQAQLRAASGCSRAGQHARRMALKVIEWPGTVQGWLGHHGKACMHNSIEACALQLNRWNPPGGPAGPAGKAPAAAEGGPLAAPAAATVPEVRAGLGPEVQQEGLLRKHLTPPALPYVQAPQPGVLRQRLRVVASHR